MIQAITSKQALMIIETRNPLGNFITVDDEWFIAIDNTKGEAYTEEFKTYKEAMEWLDTDIMF
jgi:hypothetical protein